MARDRGPMRPKGPPEPSPRCNPGDRSFRSLMTHPERVQETIPAVLQAARGRVEGGHSCSPGVSPRAGIPRPFMPPDGSGEIEELARSAGLTTPPRLDRRSPFSKTTPKAMNALLNSPATRYSGLLENRGIRPLCSSSPSPFNRFNR